MLSLTETLQKDEEFFCVCWASNEDGEPLICAAGANGVIRVVNVLSGEVDKVGHRRFSIFSLTFSWEFCKERGFSAQVQIRSPGS